ncbi:hypothetical protein [Paenibacillus sp. RC67]|uniref:hypothetical protein n=1 Tax=Paenibacillus sp. RC67 TaxID=3039392 RepID=UPI0024AD2D61|nr:hypothetical protein [Paenibacillus sp. RC67]
MPLEDIHQRLIEMELIEIQARARFKLFIGNVLIQYQRIIKAIWNGGMNNYEDYLSVLLESTVEIADRE